MSSFGVHVKRKVLNRMQPESGAQSIKIPVWWRVLQVSVWLIGFAIFIALIFVPEIGLHAFWNVLIPVAPAILVFVPGIWRNVCPMGSTSMLPDRLGVSRKNRLAASTQGWIVFAGVFLLLMIVPLRHVWLDMSGPATAMVIGGLAVIAIGMGFVFERKSGWCAGLCPVHPVEKLYGTLPALQVQNVQCRSCTACVSACPDSLRSVNPLTGNGSRARKFAGLLMIGGFPGFIWGWFHVPNVTAAVDLTFLYHAYRVPLLSVAITLVAFLLLRHPLSSDRQRDLGRLFALSAVCCYYWYRIPALFGFGLFPGDGMLVDLTPSLPAWFPLASQIVTTGGLVGWFALRWKKSLRWAVPNLSATPGRSVAVESRVEKLVQA